MNKKGFFDFGLVLILAAGTIFGTIAVNELTKDQKAEHLCKRQGSIQIGDSLYQCKKTYTLGEVRIQRVEVQKPCPACKPTIKKCGDDRKIFPLCQGLK